MHSLQNQIPRTEPNGERRSGGQIKKLKKRQQQEEILKQQRILKMTLIVTPIPKIQAAIEGHPLAPRETKREQISHARAIGRHCLAEMRLTVSSTRNETKADRAHHLSKTIDLTLVLREQKEAQQTRTKKEEQRDRSHETDQSDHLEKEEEADPDLEFTSETGHVHVEGPLHHMHGLAKNPKAKAKIAKAKAKAKIPRAKIGRPKIKMIPKESSCKDQGT